MMTDDVLVVDHHDRVLHLALNRPEKRNALSAELRHRVVESLEGAAVDDSVGAVVVSGAGGHFCAGFDLTELADAPDPAAVFADATAYHRSVHTFAKPLVAAVAGSAVAGGLDLALMCDLRLAGPDATLGQPQVRHGIPAVFELLADVIGGSAARDLCLTGRTVGAEEALQLGLIHRITAADDVAGAALRLAADIASLPAATAIKQQILELQPDRFAAP